MITLNPYDNSRNLADINSCQKRILDENNVLLFGYFEYTFTEKNNEIPIESGDNL